MGGEGEPAWSMEFCTAKTTWYIDSGVQLGRRYLEEAEGCREGPPEATLWGHNGQESGEFGCDLGSEESSNKPEGDGGLVCGD